MSILKSSSKSQGINGKMVGVLFPMELHSYFSLYVLARGLTKSILIKQLMESWMRDHLLTGTSEIELIKELTTRIKTEYEKSGSSLVNFKRELKIELDKKGINDNNIKLILKNIQ
jgi:hypothetical protein